MLIINNFGTSSTVFSPVQSARGGQGFWSLGSLLVKRSRTAHLYPLNRSAVHQLTERGWSLASIEQSKTLSSGKRETVTQTDFSQDKMSSVGAIPSSSSASTQISSKGIRLDTAQAMAMTKEVDMITVDSRRGSMSERISRHGSRRGSQIGTAERILDPRGAEGNGPLPTAAGNLTYRNLLTGTNSRLPGALMKPFAKIQRQDR